MGLRLRKYQREDLRSITAFKGRVLLAHDMGLGKTITSLAWLVRTGKFPAVVICPASVKWQWQDQAWDHFGLSSIVCSGRHPPSRGRLQPEKWDLIIINFDILDGWVTWIEDHFNIVTIVIDECQYIKNRNTKRSKATRLLCKKKKHVLALSGTPLTNRPVELFTTLNILWRKRFGSFRAFTDQYCQRRWTRWGWSYRGAKNLDRLNRQLRKYGMLRRLKKDVLKELPAKERIVVPLDISRRLEYLKAERSLAKWLQKVARDKNTRRSRQPEGLARLQVLGALGAELKMRSAFEWIDNFLDSTDRKLVVYAWHKKIVREVVKKYPNAAVIVGETPPERRPLEVRKFATNKKCRIFCGNIKAAGSGIDGLQHAASDVAFLELPWTPADLLQAEDRLCRFGQSHGVQVYFLIGKDTVEYQRVKLLQAKQGILDQVLDGKNVTQFDVYDKLVNILIKENL